MPLSIDSTNVVTNSAITWTASTGTLAWEYKGTTTAPITGYTLETNSYSLPGISIQQETPYTTTLTAPGDLCVTGNVVWVNNGQSWSTVVNTNTNGGTWTTVPYGATGVYTPMGPIYFMNKEESIKEKIRSKIKNNLLVKLGSKSLSTKVSPQEIKARDTLRDMISEREWRRYVTNGFVMVKGESGKWYQVFNNQNKTQVYEHGKKISSICIHTEGNCPPTDHIINLMLLVKLDEEAIWKLGNVAHVAENNQFFGGGGITFYGDTYLAEKESKNLIELFKNLKAA